MLHQIANHVYRLIRERSKLSYQDIGEEIGTKWQVPWRWETKQNEYLPKRTYEAKLVKLAKLTLDEFGEIMCEVLTEFVGRRFTMGQPVDYLPTVPLARCDKLYRLHRDKLGPEVQDVIDELMCEARGLDAQAESIIRVLAKEVTRLIEEGLAAKGRSLSSSGGD